VSWTWADFWIVTSSCFVYLRVDSLKSQLADTRRRLELAAARGPDRETADRLEKQFAREAKEVTERSERRKRWGRIAAWTFAVIVGVLILIWIAPTR
jgi:hypothetical protein